MTIFDQNRVPAIQGVSDDDGITLLNVYADPATNRLMCYDGTSGTDLSPDENAQRDGNFRTGLLAVSSVDGETPVPIYVDHLTNKLLIDSS
jgi:hypothetical protein